MLILTRYKTRIANSSQIALTLPANYIRQAKKIEATCARLLALEELYVNAGGGGGLLVNSHIDIVLPCFSLAIATGNNGQVVLNAAMVKNASKAAKKAELLLVESKKPTAH